MAPSYQRTSLAVALSLVVLPYAGCARRQTAQQASPVVRPSNDGSTATVSPERTKELARDEALAIARRAVEEQEDPESWEHGADYRYVRRSAAGETGVIARRIHGYDDQGRPTFTPDGHRLIPIDDAGRIIRYGR